MIQQFEGLKLEAYQCQAAVWTIGYGSTEGVKKGDRITEKQANDLLVNDLARFERAVTGWKLELSQNQFDALVSISFNCGITAIGNSTLVKKLRVGISILEIEEIKTQWLRWNKIGGVASKGLEKRRIAEIDHFWK